MKAWFGRVRARAASLWQRGRALCAGRSAAQWARDLLVLAAAGGLVLASAAGAASERYPALEVFGALQGHLAGVAAVALALGLILRAPVWASAAALALAANIGVIGYRLAHVDSCAVQMAATGERTLRLMTHNVRGANRDLAALERVFLEQRPDVLLLQEVRPHHMPLLDRLRARYPHQLLCDAHDDCGIVVLSRFPLTGSRVVTHGALVLVETRARVGDRELVLFTTHVQRPFAGRLQADQFQALIETVAELPANSVVAGDFNSALWSANLSRAVRPAGVCACNTALATWPQWLGPIGLPIDHVFLKSGVSLLSIATVPGTGSDHRALLATLGLSTSARPPR
jgi:endonuclease/exonuclease/phosphatase (EEP) superfamily protein YafD